MPIAYRIDSERQRIVTHAWGVLTNADLLAHKGRLLRDPAFDPRVPQLSDLRAIERFDVTTAGIIAMVAHDASHASQRAGHRLAVVAPTDDAFGMTRMYQLLGEREDYRVGVFRTMAEAEAWLAAG